MKKFLAALLLLCTVFAVCSCGSESSATSEPQQNSDAESTASEAVSEESIAESSAEVPEPFTVKVVDGDGNPVSGVMIQLCKDTCIPAKTADDGVVDFYVEITDGYKISVLSCPDGYTYTGDAEIYLEAGATEFTVELTKGN